MTRQLLKIDEVDDDDDDDDDDKCDDVIKLLKCVYSCS